MVERLMRMMDSENCTGPVNLGNPGEVTILELAKLVNKLTNSNAEIQFIPAREDDPMERDPDISLAREKLGWSPTVALEDGLG